MRIKLNHARIEYVGHVITGDHFLTGPKETFGFWNPLDRSDVEVGSDLYHSLLEQIVNLPEFVYSGNTGVVLSEYDRGDIKEAAAKRLSELERVKAKHTPGPWRSNNAEDLTQVSSGETNTVVAYLSACFSPYRDPLPKVEIEANRCLVNAAPQMLALLETVLADLQKEDRPGTSLSEIEEIICRAKGIQTRFDFGLEQMKLAFKEANAPLEPGEKTFRLVRTGRAYIVRKRHCGARRFYDSDTGARITKNFDAYGIKPEEITYRRLIENQRP